MLAAMKRKPTIAFDTAVCINAANGNYPRSEWQVVWKFVARNFEYGTIPLTLTEILHGIALGDAEHFEDNRKALKTLCPTHKKRFLEMPGAFTLRTVLRRRPSLVDLPGSDSLQHEAHVVMCASSKAEMLSGRVPVRETKKYSRGLDLDLVTSQMDSGRQGHIAQLERLRSGSLVAPTATEWANAWPRRSMLPIATSVFSGRRRRTANTISPNTNQIVLTPIYSTTCAIPRCTLWCMIPNCKTGSLAARKAAECSRTAIFSGSRPSARLGQGIVR